MERIFFNTIRQLEHPKHLKSQILQKIKILERKRQTRQKMLYRSGIFSSIAMLFGAVIFFGNEILSSEFWNIASLTLSDIREISYYWQEYIFSLLETFPLISVIAILAPFFFFMLSLKKYEEANFKLNFKN